MQRTLSALLVMLFVSLVVIAGVVEARELEGSFAFTSARTCTVASNQFGTDPNLNSLDRVSPTFIPNTATTPPAPPGFFFRQEATDTGILTFNENGTGTAITRSRTMNITDTVVGHSILSISDNANTFTYTVNDDGTVDLHNSEVTFTTIAGGGTGNTGTASRRTGRIRFGKGLTTFVGVNRDVIEQETVVINVRNDGTTTQFRLCNRSTIGERIRNDDRRDD